MSAGHGPSLSEYGRMFLTEDNAESLLTDLMLAVMPGKRPMVTTYMKARAEPSPWTLRLTWTSETLPCPGSSSISLLFCRLRR